MSIHDRETNKRYSDFLRCVEETPDGTYEQAKTAAALIDELADNILLTTRFSHSPVGNGDGIRNIEVAIYREMRSQNESMFSEAEEIGSNLANPDAAKKLLEGLERFARFERSAKESRERRQASLEGQ